MQVVDKAEYDARLRLSMPLILEACQQGGNVIVYVRSRQEADLLANRL